MFVATKHVFCREKSLHAATKLLSRHNYIYHDKIFLPRQIISREHVFVATSILWSRQKACFAATNTCLSPQNCVCRDKYLLQQKVCRDKIFLSRKNTCFVLINTCRDKNDTDGSSRNETLWPIIMFTFTLCVHCGYNYVHLHPLCSLRLLCKRFV